MKFESICLGHGKTPSVAPFGASNLINIRCPLVVLVHKPAPPWKKSPPLQGSRFNATSVIVPTIQLYLYHMGVSQNWVYLQFIAKFESEHGDNPLKNADSPCSQKPSSPGDFFNSAT